MTSSENTKIEIRQVLESLNVDSKKVLTEVLKIEKLHLHKGTPYGIVPEIQGAIEKVIQ